MMPRLLPMLAVRGEPFDSAEYLFEVKWNGVRALAACEQGSWQLWGRDLADYTLRYPELAFLGRLPAGTMLDGELVLFRSGLPDLEAMLARHQRKAPATTRSCSSAQPVVYVVFDALYDHGRPLLAEPLHRRRQVLERLVEGISEPRLVFSEGMVGQGRAWFEQAVAQGQEGVMAKHLASNYLPGRRSAAWRKIKPARQVPCVIVGFVPGREGLRRLLLAAPHAGQLRYVASVHAGFTREVRAQIKALLATRARTQPVVRCPGRAVWVEPDVYCMVRFLEWTRAGRLRGASFRSLLSAPLRSAGPRPVGVEPPSLPPGVSTTSQSAG